MIKPADIILTLPAEYFDTLAVIIENGVKYAAVNPLVRKELQAWWQAESGLIREEIERNANEQ